MLARQLAATSHLEDQPGPAECAERLNNVYMYLYMYVYPIAPLIPPGWAGLRDEEIVASVLASIGDSVT